jgi:hypothetical protein
MKESFVSYEFFRGSCNANGDLFYDPWFDGNVNFDSGGNIGHVSFFKSIRGMDRVVEPVYMPGWNKILGLDFTCGGLDRRVKGFL